MSGRVLAMCAALTAVGCSGSGSLCGPSEAVVTAIVDGDTVDLDTGERVRYLMIDTPELSGSECYSTNARQFNSDLVLNQTVTLDYDVECEDMFGRLLAYVSVNGQEVNRLMVEQGYACDLYIPPNGEDRRDEFASLEALAKSEGRGMWGACQEVLCDDQ